jgi:hypothetical protein
MLQQELSDVFMLPLSVEAYDELLLLQSYLRDIEYDDSSADVWSPVWDQGILLDSSISMPTVV